jgi:hypothetical protein
MCITNDIVFDSKCVTLKIQFFTANLYQYRYSFDSKFVCVEYILDSKCVCVYVFICFSYMFFIYFLYVFFICFFLGDKVNVYTSPQDGVDICTMYLLRHRVMLSVYVIIQASTLLLDLIRPQEVCNRKYMPV